MAHRDPTRLRLTGALFVGNALSSTAYLAAVTVSALAGQELLGSAHLAGLPSALSTVGSALGATLLTTWSLRIGRRHAFCLGFALSAVGGLLGVTSLQGASFGLLLASMLVLGFGRSVSQLSRFAAGDLWPESRRAKAIGFVVWAATIGSVVGPLLIVPAGRLGKAHLGAELAGPFALTALGFALAALWYYGMLRPEPLELAAAPDPSATTDESSIASRNLRVLLRAPTVRLALATLMASQFVMILLMTMTPLHIQSHHHGLGLISGVMMVHTLGMFAIAPLTGALVDRLGARRVIVLGVALLVVSALLGALATEAQATRLTVSLFLLGVGWNFGFVAGSVELQEGLTLGERLRVQGLADSATWISGGVAALASGFVLSAGSFRGLSLLGAVFALAPLALLLPPALSPPSPSKS